MEVRGFQGTVESWHVNRRAIVDCRGLDLDRVGRWFYNGLRCEVGAGIRCTRTKFKHLSRGQGMKAMLAGALAHRPPVLLLDEPFGGLDPLIREQVLVGMIDAMGTEPRSVLLTTHDLDVAARIADRVAFLANGRIEREGPVSALMSDEREATPDGLRQVMADVSGQEALPSSALKEVV